MWACGANALGPSWFETRRKAEPAYSGRLEGWAATRLPTKLSFICDAPTLQGRGVSSPYLTLLALLQLFSDDHTPRVRRKQSTGVEEPSDRKR